MAVQTKYLVGRHLKAIAAAAKAGVQEREVKERAEARRERRRQAAWDRDHAEELRQVIAEGLRRARATEAEQAGSVGFEHVSIISWRRRTPWELRKLRQRAAAILYEEFKRRGVPAQLGDNCLSIPVEALLKIADES
jgi:hypothetical protein